MKVGFIGLGKMGQGMARNLLKAGADLVVYDSNPAAVRALAEAGAAQAASVAELARQVDVLFTSLPGPPQVEEVILGADGVLAHMRPGLTLFELSTSSLSLARRIEAEFRQRGASMLDAPISGGPAGAASGELALWVSGDQAVFEQHRALLEAIGNAARYVGPVGTGTVTKLAHNLACCMVLLTMSEVFSLGVKAGVDPLDLWEAMRLGVLGKSTPLDMLTKQFLPGKYEPPAMALKLAHKDVALATGVAKELGVPMRLANLTLEEMTEALARGLGEQDTRAFLKVQLERVGVEIAVDPERLQRALAAAR
ncbi:MAG TPA: NAD(P)-dependent oxidoreductase [Ramlibacter sp.]|nr:NAD(P)-dependent oxidoreductase [Ramlibacter sp.]